MLYNSLQEVPLQTLKNIILISESRSDVFRRLSMTPRGAKFKTLNKLILKNNIDISHFKKSGEINRRKNSLKESDLKNIFKENSPNSRIKHYILKFNLIEHKCSACELGNIWNNKPLTLQLDHINGISSDNRLENLRFLCPNCHTQTETYGSKNIQSTPIIVECPMCNKPVSEQGRHCIACAHTFLQKIQWPSNKVLSELVWTKPLLKLAVDLGVSDNAIRRHCKKNNIAFPTRGFWNPKRIMMVG